jgi:hypothetical protein
MTVLRAATLCLALPWHGANAADATADDLLATLRMPDLLAAMRVEGLGYAEDMSAGVLLGSSHTAWMDEVGRLYDTDTMLGFVADAVDADMTAPEIAEATAFFSGAPGNEIVALEASARMAITDPGVEETARAAYLDLVGGGSDHLRAIRDFVEVNDLLERNVAGALTTTYQFYAGMADSGFVEMSEDDIIAEVWAQEPELRSDTETWLYGYLVMAYQPLSPDQIAEYTAFSQTPAGQSLNAALFEGFDTMFATISYSLGRRFGQISGATDL